MKQRIMTMTRYSARSAVVCGVEDWIATVCLLAKVSSVELVMGHSGGTDDGGRRVLDAVRSHGWGEAEIERDKIKATAQASAYGNKLMESELLFIKVAAIALITYPAVSWPCSNSLHMDVVNIAGCLPVNGSTARSAQLRISLQIYGSALHAALFSNSSPSHSALR